MAMKITVIATKGGVGKTTLVANLAGMLADIDRRVLIIDGDTGQPTLSSYYPIISQAPAGLTQLFQSTKENIDHEQLISRTCIQNLDLIYSDDPNAELQQWLTNQPDGRMRLKVLLKTFDEKYDFIIVDTRGSVGPAQDAAAVAADMLLSPILPEMASAREFLRGTLGMLTHLAPMEAYGFPIANLFGIINRLDNTADARLITSRLKGQCFEESNGKVSLCKTVIPAAVAYRNATTQQKPTHRIDQKTTNKAACALDTMQALVRELFPHLAETTLSTEAIMVAEAETSRRLNNGSPAQSQG